MKIDEGPVATKQWPPSSLQEVVGVDVGLSEDGSQCPLRQIARMIRDGRVAVRLRIVPDFVAAGSVTVKSESEAAQLLDRFRIFESSQSAHG